RGDLGADRRPSRPVRTGPLPGDQAAVPPQDGAGADEPVYLQLVRQVRDQRGEDRGVGPVQPGQGLGAAQPPRPCLAYRPRSWTYADFWHPTGLCVAIQPGSVSPGVTWAVVLL